MFNLFHAANCRRLVSVCLVLSVQFLFCSSSSAQQADLYNVGVAAVDITPDYPIRLNGFGNRREESEGVSQHIYARAIAISQGDEPPLVLVTLDSLGVRTAMVDEVRRRLKESHQLPRKNLAVTFSHSHCTPKVNGACDNIFSKAIPKEHQKHIDRYTKELTDYVTTAARKAIESQTPATLEWGVGKVGFAKNRRTAGGPVDHDLPMLVVRDAKSRKIRTIYVSYACHCVTLRFNQISGDWAGYASAMIERRFPDAIALVSIGAGSDQNPNSGVTLDKTEVAQGQGLEIAVEVERLLKGQLKKVTGTPAAVLNNIDLPLNKLPTQKQLKEQTEKGRPANRYNATTQLEKLKQGQPLLSKIDYPIQTWSFGNSLCINFLAGEVCVDYALRLKSEMNQEYFWLNTYSNDFCCYIPSERLLKEGGYGGGGEVPYFALPTTLKTGVEKLIIDEVHRQVPDVFHQPKGTRGIAPKTPLDSLRSMNVHANFDIQLVAAEPQVTDPVAIDFGTKGQLWVAEMNDYGRGVYENFNQGSRIRCLYDVDGDGYFEKSQVFLDGLRFPTDIKAWRDGVLICDAPDILFARDKNGDGVADETTKLFYGFSIQNAQARVNSLRWGLDNWVHGASGIFGGTITSPLTKQTVDCNNRDFRLNPDTGAIEPVSGRAQQGRCRNDWGDWFGCSNSSLLFPISSDHQYEQRNPFSRLSSPYGVAFDSEAYKLYPPENLVTFELSGASGRATAACGLGIYRDSVLGTEFMDDAFTCEPVHQSVHRIELSRSSHGFNGKRGKGEESSEFLSSNDRWFRPVQARTGPDGGLWVVDMYRFVIEHSRWIPQATLAEVDVFAGKKRGRIYRVIPKKKSHDKTRVIPNLASLNNDELVKQLASSNGTVRDLVQQMLIWRSAADTAPAIRQIFTQSENPSVQIQVLSTLAGLKKLTVDDILLGVNSEHAEVVRFAVRSSEPFLSTSKALRMALFDLKNNKNVRVRRQLALSIGVANDPKTAETLALLIGATEPDSYVRSAALNSINADNISPVLSQYLTQPVQKQNKSIRQNLFLLALQLGDSKVVQRVLLSCLPSSEGAIKTDSAELLASALQALDTRQGADKLEVNDSIMKRLHNVHHAALKSLNTPQHTESDCLVALKLLGRNYGSFSQKVIKAGNAAEFLNPDQRATAIASIISPRHSAKVQQAAIKSIGGTGSTKAPTMLLDVYPTVGVESRLAIIDGLLSRNDGSLLLLSALKSGEVRAGILDAGRRSKLLSSPNTQVRESARRILEASGTSSRTAVVKSFEKVIGMKSDLIRGKAVFKKQCSACHKLEGEGHVVGPDLQALTNHDPQWLLGAILDPNKNVDARYLLWTTVTVDGLTASGMNVEETATSIRLREAGGKEHLILRSKLEEFISSEKSIMPEGLERDMSAQDFADVIAYLSSFESPPKKFDGNNPQTIQPNKDGQLHLSASAAEIRGGEIKFEAPLSNIGFWHHQNDSVKWKISLPKSDLYDVYVVASCDSASAGNQFQIEGMATSLTGKVSSTGGWDQYRAQKVGTTKINRSALTITARSVGPVAKALFDLQEIRLVPAGKSPKFAVANLSDAPLPRHASEIAPFLLDESQSKQRREQVIAQRPGMGAAIVSLLAAGIKPDDIEDEYRRIPWIWRVAIAVGKRNDGGEIGDLLKVSLPSKTSSLRDWQAVVIGGGVINGISQLGIFPAKRLNEILENNPTVKADWLRTLELAAAMADNNQIRSGTRYDALRMVAMRDETVAVAHLLRYLTQQTPRELQMGALSGLVDIESPAVIAPLADSLKFLKDRNRYLVIKGLLRTDKRTAALTELFKKGQLKLTTAEKESLLNHPVEALRDRAKKLLE